MSALAGPVTAQGIKNPNLSTDLYVHRAERVRFGNEEKYALTATLGKTGVGKEVRLFQRPYYPDVVQRWLHCLDIGIPVPTTVREAPIDRSQSYYGKVLLITDVTAKGAAVYGKGLNFNQYREPRRPNGPLASDPHFMKLTNEANMPTLRERAHAFADHATSHNTILPSEDSFELIINPDGSSQLMVLDLEHVDPRTSEHAAFVKSANTLYVESTLSHLTRLRSHLGPLLSE